MQRRRDTRGLTTKAGQPFLAGPLYHLLQNPIYIGRIRHKEAVYHGLHPAIIDQDLWDAVQPKLAQNRVARHNGAHARQPSLLAGLLWDDAGRRFTPSHAVKDGKRYRYYVQRLRPDERVPGRKPRLKRLPAAEIEGIVTDAAVRLLGSPSELINALDDTESPAHHTKDVIDAGARLAEVIPADTVERHAWIRAL
ncbi:MAG: recombinase family protein, partial [Alphaproteobacteria bacterium]